LLGVIGAKPPAFKKKREGRVQGGGNVVRQSDVKKGGSAPRS